MPTTRVDDEVWLVILKAKHRLEIATRRIVSMTETLRFLYTIGFKA